MTIKIPQEHIDKLIEASKEAVWEPFPGITIVAWRLPNGFVIVDESGCIDPKAYDREIGLTIAREHLTDKVWELEGYRAKQHLYEVDFRHDH